MNLEDIETTTLPLNFSACSSGPTDFNLNLNADITSLETLNDMLDNSPNDQDNIALELTRHGLQKNFSAAHVAPVAQSRLRWSIEKLKLTPKTMVEENGTPWQHTMLYQEYMPQMLQDSYRLRTTRGKES
jgi:hypothetical protein